MNDKQLDHLIERYGQGYNHAPDGLPIASILEKVHQRLERRRYWPAIAALAAAAVIVIIASMTLRPRTEVIQATQANAALESAIEAAEKAVRVNPDDPYFVKHLSAMKENAAEFEKISTRLSRSL
jgi:hypothetical protein